MTVTKEDFQYMVEATVSDLVRMLMEQTGASMHEAFDKVYGSETYRALNDPQSTYYYQSPGYVYEQLQSELKYQPLKTVNNMEKYVCDVCGYVYDPAVGDPDNGIAPGTKFEDLPADWVCPLCSVDKTHFEKNA